MWLPILDPFLAPRPRDAKSRKERPSSGSALREGEIYLAIENREQEGEL